MNKFLLSDSDLIWFCLTFSRIIYVEWLILCFLIIISQNHQKNENISIIIGRMLMIPSMLYNLHSFQMCSKESIKNQFSQISCVAFTKTKVSLLLSSVEFNIYKGHWAQPRNKNTKEYSRNQSTYRNDRSYVEQSHHFMSSQLQRKKVKQNKYNEMRNGIERKVAWFFRLTKIKWKEKWMN